MLAARFWAKELSLLSASWRAKAGSTGVALTAACPQGKLYVCLDDRRVQNEPHTLVRFFRLT